MQRSVSVGDFVRYAHSSVDAVGLIVDERDKDYVLVRWEGGLRTTHKRASLEAMPLVQRPSYRS